MSSAQASAHAADSGAHGSVRSYMVGFVLSLVLTVLSFGTVMAGLVPHSMMLTWIVVFAVAQLLVQLVYFLHLGTSPDQRANVAIFLFTGVIITTVVAGSLWVMHNADVNMMPMHMTPEGAMSVE
jgi:cytochrome o ubiquinol oxidase operon protein cyoD